MIIGRGFEITPGRYGKNAPKNMIIIPIVSHNISISTIIWIFVHSTLFQAIIDPNANPMNAAPSNLTTVASVVGYPVRIIKPSVKKI